MQEWRQSRDLKKMVLFWRASGFTGQANVRLTPSAQNHVKYIFILVGNCMVNCTLRQPSPDDMKTLYKWKIEEPHHDWYSCQPVHPFGTFEEFYKKTLDRLTDPARIHRILVDNGNNELLGEIKGFDLNERNHSMEFGYYLPESKRGRGYGKIMIQLFINEVFTESQINLNKLYATTSGNNERSKQVLERTGFKLNGKNREHYWIGNKRYDQYVYSLLRNEWDEMNSRENRSEEI